MCILAHVTIYIDDNYFKYDINIVTMSVSITDLFSSTLDPCLLYINKSQNRVKG